MAATSARETGRAAAQFLRRHPGLLVVVAVVALVVVAGRAQQLPGQGGTAAQEAPGGGSEAAAGEEPDRSGGEGGTPTGGGSGGSGGGGSGGEEETDPPARSGGAGGASDPGPDATGPPVDVAHDRPSVDLDQVPAGRDAVAVARWWAAAYTAYAGAEPGADLGRRLAELTTPALRADLASTPPPASYNEPVAVVGVSAREPSEDGSVWVTVETPGALVVYDLALTREAGAWLVDGVRRL